MQDSQHNTILSCQSATKYFDEGGQRVHILKGIDLAIQAQESVAIVGVSGSGKSTLLHLLGGLDTVSSGKVSLNGEDIADLSEKQLCRYRNEHIGFVYQFHHLLGDFNVLENVLMPMRIYHRKTPEMVQRATQLLEQVGLEHRIRHKPHQLSGGERQRVALCRSLVTQPSVVLADEPTGQLDKENAKKVVEEMIRLNKELGVSLVVATHDSAFAERLDRTYRLEDGILQQD